MKHSTVCALSVMVLLVSGTLQAEASAAANSGPRVTTLVLHPSQLDTGKSYLLLWQPEDQIEGDAVPLYDKAVENMPTNMDTGQLRQWTRLPLSELPQDEVQALLQRAQASLDTLAKAARCKSCNWPAFQPGSMPSNLSEYRTLTYIVYVKTRQEIAQKRYDDAIATMRMGLTMARQIGEAPTLVQGLVGIAMAAVMLRGVDDLTQGPDSPNLYAALETLPRPFVDIEKPIATEMNALETSTQYTGAVRDVMRKQLEPAHERTRQIARRLVGDLNARQCIEAVRHYTATHDGKLPAQLGDITTLELPNDPVTKEPFTYRLEGEQAILQTGIPEGGSPREAMRFEITVAR